MGDWCFPRGQKISRSIIFTIRPAKGDGHSGAAIAGKEILVLQNDSASSIIKRIAFVGNYLPRRCGIATFTTDLCEAVAAENGGTTCIALPVNDTDEGYAYPGRVRFELTEKDIESYRRAADFLNINNVNLVCLQHEYGIFGGRAGSHILALLRELRMPIVTILHTILAEPNADQRSVLEEVANLSDRLVVMSQRGKEFLAKIYHSVSGCSRQARGSRMSSRPCPRSWPIIPTWSI
jgi:hypothetical protein